MFTTTRWTSGSRGLSRRFSEWSWIPISIFRIGWGFGSAESCGWDPAFRRSRIPNRPEKIEIGIQDHFENRRKSELNQDVYPVVVKIAEIYFFGRFGAKNGPRMVSESVRLGSPSPQEIALVKNLLMEISISSKNPPTLGWLGVSKMYLTQKLLIGKHF